MRGVKTLGSIEPECWVKPYLPPGFLSAALPPQLDPSEAVCHEWSHGPATAAGEKLIELRRKAKMIAARIAPSVC